VTAQYTYNALNQRVRSTANSTITEYVFNANGQRASVWNGSNYLEIQGEYYWGSQPVAYHRSSAAHFQHQDWLGTERIRTTYNGNVEGTFTSLAFGDDQTTASGTDTDTYHYAMLDHDGETNTDHAQFRQYSNTQGRWLSPDPYSGSYDFNDPQSFNRYVYASNNPLSAIDPSGLESDGVCGDGEDFCDQGGEDTGDNGYDASSFDSGFGSDGGGGPDPGGSSGAWGPCGLLSCTVTVYSGDTCNFNDPLCQWTYQAGRGVPGGIPPVGGQGGPHGSGSTINSTASKFFGCAGKEFLANGNWRSLGLDALGVATGFLPGGAVVQTIASIAVNSAATINSGLSANMGTAAGQRAAAGSFLSAAGVPLSAFKMVNVIPWASTVTSGISLLNDSYQYGSDIASCMSRH